MNEKIKQLCEQAKAYANESTKDFTGDEPVVWMDYYTEKFAELIVKQSATLADNWAMFDEGPLQYGPVGEKIKEHFGLK